MEKDDRKRYSRECVWLQLIIQRKTFPGFVFHPEIALPHNVILKTIKKNFYQETFREYPLKL